MHKRRPLLLFVSVNRRAAYRPELVQVLVVVAARFCTSSVSERSERR